MKFEQLTPAPPTPKESGEQLAKIREQLAKVLAVDIESVKNLAGEEAAKKIQMLQQSQREQGSKEIVKMYPKLIVTLFFLLLFTGCLQKFRRINNIQTTQVVHIPTPKTPSTIPTNETQEETKNNYEQYKINPEEFTNKHFPITLQEAFNKWVGLINNMLNVANTNGGPTALLDTIIKDELIGPRTKNEFVQYYAPAYIRYLQWQKDEKEAPQMMKELHSLTFDEFWQHPGPTQMLLAEILKIMNDAIGRQIDLAIYENKKFNAEPAEEKLGILIIKFTQIFDEIIRREIEKPLNR